MSKKRIVITAMLAGLGFLPALADHPAPKATDDKPVELMEGLGDLQHPITTADPAAQKFFNQGLRLVYAFNHDEAIRAFRAAAKADPKCAMAHWGIALCLGPNYNLPAEKDNLDEALAEIAKARALAAGANPKEVAYIEALAKRYSNDDKIERPVLDQAYADAMRDVSQKFPEDLDASVLFAEAQMNVHPWDLWDAEGKPKAGTEAIIGALEAVLSKNANHTGANHYYIHAVEASTDPERALASARRLGDLAPAAGHLIHMPAHIFFRLGMYEDAVESNRRATEADRKYLAKNNPQGIYRMMYYPHNIHFLSAAHAMQGQSAAAIDAATELGKELSPEMAVEMPMVEYFVPARLYALARFEKWDAILEEKKPPETLKYATAMWHYTRGKALVGHNKLEQAREEHATLMKILEENAPHDLMFMRHSVPQLLELAGHDLKAGLEAGAGNVKGAVAELRQAVKMQDALAYDEPPPWYFPEREALGRMLLKAEKPKQAQKVFREDLKRNLHNPWSLYGLEQSLRARGQQEKAENIHKRFAKGWAKADIAPR